MTTDQIRDELYRIKALGDLVPGHGYDMEWAKTQWTDSHCRWCDRNSCHPFSPTLDGANAAVPCGWKWARYPRGSDAVWVWVGIHADTGRHIDVPDTGNLIHDLYQLALACVRAEEKI